MRVCLRPALPLLAHLSAACLLATGFAAGAAHADEAAPAPVAVTPVASEPPPVAVTTPAAPPADAGALQLTAAGRATALRFSAFAIDRSSEKSNDGPVGDSRITLRADLDTGRRLGDWSATATLAVDALTGAFAGRPTAEGDKLPQSHWNSLVPTQALAGVGLRDLGALRVGLMTSHWGMGLVANDGGHAFDGRRDSWFALPTTGDRVARAQLILQPFGRSGGDLRGLYLIGAADAVVEDANAVWDKGDRAYQQVGAARFHLARERWLGLYYVHRDQKVHSENGPFLRVHVIDAAFDLDYRQAGAGLRVQGEAAMILGRTSLGPSPDFPEHDVRQGAAVARARWQSGDLGLRLEFDAGWFSGDANLDDGAVTGFKANPNFQQGLVLFSQVLGWQSGRARRSASDPMITGYPAQDLDRLATNGSVTSAITAFPKVGWKFAPQLEVYGGALLAFSPTPPVDPFATRAMGGGTPRNALGKAPDGNVLGTEIDLGVAAGLAPAEWPVSLELRGEYGVLVPGGVLDGMDGLVHGGRLSLAVLPPLPTKK
ncbi:MAG: hypothetical protein HY902_09995 [Deltaproteobacteria bacterium]|nr:hypothetical protein [Deltaproteobacteria bacterium]